MDIHAGLFIAATVSLMIVTGVVVYRIVKD